MTTTTTELRAPPLTDKSQPWVVVEFTHFRDGQRHRFYSAVNEMTGNRLSAFDSDPPAIGDPLAWVRSVIRDIRAKASDVRVIGSKGLIALPKIERPK